MLLQKNLLLLLRGLHSLWQNGTLLLLAGLHLSGLDLHGLASHESLFLLLLLQMLQLLLLLRSHFLLLLRRCCALNVGQGLQLSLLLLLRLSRHLMVEGVARPGDGFDDPHEDAGLGAVALRLDRHQGDEGVEGAVRPRDGVAGDLAEAGERVEALQRGDEEMDVVEGEVGDQLVVDRPLLVEDGLDEGLVELDGAELAEDVEAGDHAKPVGRGDAGDEGGDEHVGGASLAEALHHDLGGDVREDVEADLVHVAPVRGAAEQAEPEAGLVPRQDDGVVLLEAEIPHDGRDLQDALAGHLPGAQSRAAREQVAVFILTVVVVILHLGPDPSRQLPEPSLAGIGLLVAVGPVPGDGLPTSGSVEHE